MSYNIHPIFVHFPIALLVLYSIIKIAPLSKWFPKVSWKHIERALLVVGVLGAFIADTTGEMAEHLVHPNRQLVEMHSTFAGISEWLYGLLLLGEVLVVSTPTLIPKLKMPKVTSVLIYIQKILTHSFVAITLAILGLIAISVTGLLGGTIVYGITADPFAAFVVHILGISL